jgi:radical SAM protein with 4Fe4S-binding SPASM domain
MRLRAEPWGAWIRLERAPLLLAVDHAGLERLAIDPPAPQPGPSAPLEVHVAVTSRCAAGCSGCYLDATPDGETPPKDEIVRRLRGLAEAGVFTVAFGGGEPLVRDDLGDLARAARALDLVPVMTTSGLGLTPARARDLRDFAQINVSYDGQGADYAEIRGYDGARHAERAIEALVAAGIRTGANVVLSRSTLARTADTLARARSLGCVDAQLLRYKPRGRAASPDYLARRLSPEQVRGFPALLRAWSQAASPMSLRVDCSMIPWFSTDPSLADPAALRRFGIFGCEAGGHLAALRVDGATAPCSFLPPGDDDGRRARAVDPAEPCRSCPLFAVCKGGCKAVAAFTGDPWAPDPECPKVAAWRGETARARVEPTA